MANSMPSEVLERFKRERGEAQAPSGEEAKMATRKRAKNKARRHRESRGEQG